MSPTKLVLLIIPIHIIMSNSQLWPFCTSKANELLQKRAAETAGLEAAFWPPALPEATTGLQADLRASLHKSSSHEVKPRSCTCTCAAQAGNSEFGIRKEPHALGGWTVRVFSLSLRKGSASPRDSEAKPRTSVLRKDRLVIHTR